jgi:hypothetical protein
VVEKLFERLSISRKIPFRTLSRLQERVTSLGERPKPEGAALRGKKSGEGLFARASEFSNSSLKNLAENPEFC